MTPKIRFNQNITVRLSKDQVKELDKEVKKLKVRRGELTRHYILNGIANSKLKQYGK